MRSLLTGDCMKGFEEIFPPHVLPVRVQCFRCPVEPRDLGQVTLASVDEVATFAIDKRRDEHLTGRWLLAQAVTQWGLEPSTLEVRRTPRSLAEYAFAFNQYWTFRRLGVCCCC
jgi:hypothetical protein